MSSSPTLVILAAGAGCRYGGLKQLASIGPGGATLLEYSVYDALQAGFSRVVLVVRPETEALFRERFDAGMARRVEVAYVHQTLDDLPDGYVGPPGRVRPWGTGHAVLVAERKIDGPFASLNADDFYGADSFARLSGFLRDAKGAELPALAVTGFPVAQTLTDAGAVSRALCRVDDQGFLREIVEIKEVWRRDGRVVYHDAGGAERRLAGDKLVSMNMWGFPPEVFPLLRREFESFLARESGAGDAEFLLPDIVRLLVRAERVRVEVLHGSGPWCGITYRDDERRTAAFLLRLVSEGRYPEELWS